MRKAIEKKLNVETNLKRSITTGTAVCFVRYSKNDTARHWVVMRNEWCHDPALNYRIPKDKLEGEITTVINIH